MPDTSKPRELLLVVDWEQHVTAELRKKCKLPWRWCRLDSGDLDTHADLSLAEVGAFTRLLQLATLTDNRTEYKPDWLRRRAGLTSHAVRMLIERGLARIETIDDSKDVREKTPENQANDPAPSGQHPDDIRTAAGLHNITGHDTTQHHNEKPQTSLSSEFVNDVIEAYNTTLPDLPTCRALTEPQVENLARYVGDRKAAGKSADTQRYWQEFVFERIRGNDFYSGRSGTKASAYVGSLPWLLDDYDRLIAMLNGKFG